MLVCTHWYTLIQFLEKVDKTGQRYVMSKEFLTEWTSQLSQYNVARDKQRQLMQDGKRAKSRWMLMTGSLLFGLLACVCTNEWFIESTFTVWWASVYFYLAVNMWPYPASHGTQPTKKALKSRELPAASHTACLIACHNSVKKNIGLFECVLRSAAKRFGADGVFVCDNSNERAPSPVDYNDKYKVDTRLLCQRLGVNYCFVPEGNKSLALLWVARCWLPQVPHARRFSQILIMDDDVLLPWNLPVPALTGLEVGCSYPICAITKEIVKQQVADLGGLKRFVVQDMREVNSFTNATFTERIVMNLQNLEYYQLNATLNLQYQLSGSCMYGCGALSLWRRDFFIEKVMANHTSMFDGEDVRSGLLVQIHGKPYSLRYEPDVQVPTSVPVNMFTTRGNTWSREKSLWNQRVNSWEHLTHRFLPLYLHHLLHYWHSAYIMIKVFILSEIALILMDYANVPLLAYALYTCTWSQCWDFVVLCFGLACMSSTVFYFRTLSSRPDLKATLSLPLILVYYPIYGAFIKPVFRLVALLSNWFTNGISNKPEDVVLKQRYEDGSFPPPIMQNKRATLPMRDHVGDWSRIWQEASTTQPNARRNRTSSTHR